MFTVVKSSLQFMPFHTFYMSHGTLTVLCIGPILQSCPISILFWEVNQQLESKVLCSPAPIHPIFIPDLIYVQTYLTTSTHCALGHFSYHVLSNSFLFLFCFSLNFFSPLEIVLSSPLLNISNFFSFPSLSSSPLRFNINWLPKHINAFFIFVILCKY